MKGSTTKGT